MINWKEYLTFSQPYCWFASGQGHIHFKHTLSGCVLLTARNESSLSVWSSAGRCLFQKYCLLQLEGKAKTRSYILVNTVYPSRSGWFRTKPNDACVVCVQCVIRGLFSDLIMSTQFILTYFVPKLGTGMFVCLSHKINVCTYQAQSLRFTIFGFIFKWA